MRICSRGGKVLAVEVIVLALADAVRKRDIVSGVDGDRLCGNIATAVGIRARDGVVARTANGYCRIGRSIAPRIRARACSRKRNVITLTETVVAADAHIR